MVMEALRTTGRDPRNRDDTVRRRAVRYVLRMLKESDVVDPGPEAIIADLLKLLPESEASTSKPVDLRQTTFDLLPLVREPSTSELKALKAKRFEPFVVMAKSLAQVVAENPGHFWSNRLEYVSGRPQLQDYVPPEMVVALNPTRLALPDSFRKSRPTQLEMIDQYSRDEIEVAFPGAKAIMLPATAYAQASIAYSQNQEGKVLFTDYFARALDDTSEVDAAIVGRRHPGDQLGISGCHADGGTIFVGAVPAVVFLQE